ncbi:3-hydroxybutyryl-CoA dehydrogenase [Cryobacterium mesophilum]|uniref:3-hydroxyacyl-CoA dehydrogenase family protein n=1 Tax=Terrimesophilobacter mesophilus TaxID=433647 RepID=A0A4R8VDD2_9MICO|nr:3-hydroxyacyl-CoA dehydrogenase family protein [Terrimesophilobacter mesophilus]MBB5634032.1 3-hydroxybutyryl-CoA dehydrogenase [Terrimesophilobacter mesophilus]TFB81381.1 3-hydroxyacyl-CoA dehydrogenase family protein [Terrimesophilobacter mesophilus]
MTAVPAVVGVLGGGRMGAGIAHAFVLAGSRVAVVERDAESVRMARGRVLAAFTTSIERATTTEPLEKLTARIAVGTDLAAFAEAELVIEAVPESLELKLDALARVEDAVPPLAWLASNTSSISITTLGRSLQRPERFLGLHFFNPVPASGLVEIVVGEESADELVTSAQGWVHAIGKAPITVKDVPGFASSRLGLVLGLEAIRMLEDGVASAEDIDAAMVLGYGHPMGPLRLTDVVGLDVRLGIAEYLRATLGERFAPPALLRDMVERGELGRKSGKGFYEWPAVHA